MPRYIAEISSNHCQDINRIMHFITTSAEIGCDAIKFQLFKINDLYSQEVFKNLPEVENRREWELPVNYLEKIAREAKIVGIKFGCTPFYLEAIDELDPFVDFYKIASYELLWLELIEKCTQRVQPLIISTGMATMDEIMEAKKIIDFYKKENVAFLHCESSYPVSPNQTNLAAIATMRNFLKCSVGWSDHSRDPAVILRAAHKWNADIFEFHLDLDGKGDEYKQGHCWLPHELEKTIRLIETGKIADGDGIKVPGISELDDRQWRADPSDGLRPLKSKRTEISNA